MLFLRKVVYFIVVVLLITSLYRLNFSLDSLIPQDFKDYQVRSQINTLSMNIITLSKALNELKKKKQHKKISLQRKNREESYRKGKEAASKKRSNHILTDCTKISVQEGNDDPLIRPKSFINDADTRRRKKVIKFIPHSICPLSLNPKKSDKEYLFWIDKAQKKHLKFQSDYLKKINCEHHRSTAQFSQDIRLHRRFFHFEKDLIFVEVGAFDGVVFSK
jgi:hypothetical protein